MPNQAEFVDELMLHLSHKIGSISLDITHGLEKSISLQYLVDFRFIECLLHHHFVIMQTAIAADTPKELLMKLFF